MNIETIERARKCISRFVAEFDAEQDIRVEDGYNKEEEPSWVKEGRLLTQELKMKIVFEIGFVGEQPSATLATTLSYTFKEKSIIIVYAEDLQNQFKPEQIPYKARPEMIELIPQVDIIPFNDKPFRGSGKGNSYKKKRR